jgi:hypothetical protein
MRFAMFMLVALIPCVPLVGWLSAHHAPWWIYLCLVALPVIERAYCMWGKRPQ